MRSTHACAVQTPFQGLRKVRFLADFRIFFGAASRYYSGGTFFTPFANKVPKSDPKVTPRAPKMVSFFVCFSLFSPRTPRWSLNRCFMLKHATKVPKSYPKGCQNDAKLDPEVNTHMLPFKKGEHFFLVVLTFFGENIGGKNKLPGQTLEKNATSC